MILFIASIKQIVARETIARGSLARAIYWRSRITGPR